MAYGLRSSDGSSDVCSPDHPLDQPALATSNIRGGMVLKPEFTALWFALSVYTSSFITEIVRSGIQAVSHGQTEAAYALGVRPNWTMRLIVIPQALRVI